MLLSSVMQDEISFLAPFGYLLHARSLGVLFLNVLILILRLFLWALFLQIAELHRLGVVVEQSLLLLWLLGFMHRLHQIFLLLVDYFQPFVIGYLLFLLLSEYDVSDFFPIIFGQPLTALHWFVRAFLVIGNGFKHVRKLSGHYLIFIGPELDSLHFISGEGRKTRLVGGSYFIAVSLCLLDLYGLEELSPGSELRFVFSVYGVVLFGPLKVLDYVVDLEKVTADESFPQVVVDIVVGSVDEVDQVGQSAINYQTRKDVPNKNPISLWETGV